MYVYVLVKEYYNNVAIVEQVFSSKKKADDHLKWLISMNHKDGWTISRGEAYYVHKNGNKVPFVEFGAPSGNPNNLERRYILKEKVA